MASVFCEYLWIYYSYQSIEVEGIREPVASCYLNFVFLDMPNKH